MWQIKVYYNKNIDTDDSLFFNNVKINLYYDTNFQKYELAHSGKFVFIYLFLIRFNEISTVHSVK